MLLTAERATTRLCGVTLEDFEKLESGMTAVFDAERVTVRLGVCTYCASFGRSFSRAFSLRYGSIISYCAGDKSVLVSTAANKDPHKRHRAKTKIFFIYVMIKKSALYNKRIFIYFILKIVSTRTDISPSLD